MGQDPSILNRLQAEYQEATGQRQSLQRWMEDNHGALSGMFGDERINWVWLTDWLTRHGFRNGDGTHLKRETVRRVWARVKSDKRTLRKRRDRRVDHASMHQARDGRDLFGAKGNGAGVAAAAPSRPARPPEPERVAVPAAQVAEEKAPPDLMAALRADINKASSRG